MSWLYSQALVEEYSQDICLDGEPYARLNVMPTPQGFWRNDKMMDCSRLSRFGVTLKVLTESNGEAVLKSFLAAFPVRTLVVQEKGQALRGGQEVDCGQKWRASLAKYDPATHSLKTAQCSLLEGSTESCVTLPKWGLLQNGGVYQQPIAALNISENEYGLLPTPVASPMGSNTTMRKRGETAKSRYLNWATPVANDALNRGNFDPGKSPGLAAQDKSFPTPQARDWKGPSGRSLKGHEFDLPTAVKRFPTPCASDGSRGGVITDGMTGQSLPQLMNTLPESENVGQLNPEWVEWLMYWPIGWTSLKPLSKDLFNKWLQRDDWLNNEPEGVPRVTKGIKYRVDRLKAIGNGQFPLSAQSALNLLKN